MKASLRQCFPIYWRLPFLLIARGRATARLAELDELMLLMSSSWGLRPALEEVWVSAQGKSSMKFPKKFREKSPKNFQKNDPKNDPKNGLSKGPKNHWKNTALWSVFLPKKSRKFHEKMAENFLQNFATSKKCSPLDEKFVLFKRHRSNGGVKFL